MSEQDRLGQRIDGGGPWVRQLGETKVDSNPENLVVMPATEQGNLIERVSLQVANPIQLMLKWMY